MTGTNYTPPDYAIKRLRYFTGQFLQAQDFVDEQSYHIDVQQRHERCLHVSGITSGLTITDWTNNVLTVAAGSAVDANGRQILYDPAQLAQLPSPPSADSRTVSRQLTKARLHLTIAFGEITTDTQKDSGSERRFTQSPVFAIIDASAKTDDLILATFTTDANGVVEGSGISYADCTYSGVGLPGPGATIALRAKADGTGAELGSNLAIDGALSFGSTKGQKIDLCQSVHAVGVQEQTTYFRTSDYFGWYQNGAPSTSKLDAGTGGTELMILGAGGGLAIGSAFAAAQVVPPSGLAVQGSVGVGTASPSASLHVQGTSTQAQDTAFLVQDSGSRSLLSVTNDGSVRLKVGATLWLGDNGKICSNDPTHTIWFRRSSNILELREYGDIYLTAGARSTTDGDTTSDLPRLVVHQSGNVGIGLGAAGAASTMAPEPRGRLEVQGSTSDDQSNALRVANATQQALLVVRDDVKIGVGLDAPSATLEVRGASTLNTDTALQVSNATPATLFQVQNNGDVAVLAGALGFGTGARQMINLSGPTFGIGVQAGQAGTQYFRSPSTFAWYRGGSHASSAFDPGTGGAVLMVIDPSGRVGVGTTTPGAQLEVDIPATSTSASFKLEHHGSNLVVRPNAAGGNTTVVENTAGPLVLNPAGANVGIGTPTPNANLEIAGTFKVSATSGALTYDGALSLVTTANGTGGVALTHDANNTLSVNGATKFTGGIKLWGAVNTTSTLSVANQLTVGAGLVVSNGAITPTVGNTSASGIQFPANPGGGSGDQAYIRYYRVGTTGETTKLLIGIDNDADDTLGFWQQGAERMTVYGGNVGIGTTTPGARLEVVGTVSVFGAWDTTSYQFGKNYQAKTDGFVVARIYDKKKCDGSGCDGARGFLWAYSDSSAAPTSLRASASMHDWKDNPHCPEGSLTMPVRKGDYWRVDYTATGVSPGSQISWIPLGKS